MNRRERNRAARRALLKPRASRRQSQAAWQARGDGPDVKLARCHCDPAHQAPEECPSYSSWLDPIVDEQRAIQAAQGITPELLADAAEADETIDADELERHAADLSARKTKAARG